MGPFPPKAWMVVVATQQQQQAEEHQRVLQHLVDQQRSMRNQLVAAQVQTSQKLWKHSCSLYGRPQVGWLLGAVKGSESRPLGFLR